MMNVVDVKTNGSEITIKLDAYSIIHDMLSVEQRSELIQSLSCAEDVIKHVADQLIHGCTDEGFSGSWSSSCNTALQLAIERVAKNSSYAVKTTIKQLRNRIDALEKENLYLRTHDYDFGRA